MSYFIRALGVTLSVTLLLFVFIIGFDFIGTEAAQSGFSSGTAFAFEHGDGAFYGEIFGRSFYADISFLEPAFSAAKRLSVFLPPVLKFVVRGIYFLF